MHNGNIDIYIDGKITTDCFCFFFPLVIFSPIWIIYMLFRNSHSKMTEWTPLQLFKAWAFHKLHSYPNALMNVCVSESEISVYQCHFDINYFSPCLCQFACYLWSANHLIWHRKNAFKSLEKFSCWFLKRNEYILH